ncbi:MAG: hypothetical protein AAF678_09475 [Pseudomonadota bacterium]
MTALEALSYIVTILGFPAAIWVIWREERFRRANEKAELHRQLSEEYNNFLRLAMENSDLLLLSRRTLPSPVSEEQAERMEAILRILISLFEKAYIILYRDEMDDQARRRWMSWEDEMIEWCDREEFRTALPALLDGEDAAFSRYITDLAARRDVPQAS